MNRSLVLVGVLLALVGVVMITVRNVTCDHCVDGAFTPRDLLIWLND